MKAFDYYLSSTLCFIGGGLILGLTLNDPESHSKSIIQAVMSERYFYVLLIEMAISGQMLLDIIIDNISAGKKMFSTKGSKVNLSVLLSLFISSLLIISYVMPYSKYVFLISIRQSRLIFMYAITVSMAQHYNKAMWNSTYLKVSFFITSTGSILRIISVSGGVEPQGIYASCSKASWALILISGIPTIIYFVGKWSWQIYYTSKKRNLTADEINCTVYVFTYIICTILVLIASSTFDPAYLGSNLSLPANTEDYFAMSFDLIYTVYVVIIGMHQVRTLRKEATQYKAKKAGVELKVTVNSTRSSNNSMIDACREDFSDKVVLKFVRSSSSSSRIHPREISTVTTNANANANATGESSMEGLLGQFPLEFTSPNNVDGGGDRRERMMPYIDGSPYDCSLNLHQVEVTEGWDKFKMRNTTVDPKVADGRRIDIGNEQPTAPSKLSEVRMYPIPESEIQIYCEVPTNQKFIMT
eukprot:gene3900-7781_t